MSFGIRNEEATMIFTNSTLKFVCSNCGSRTVYTEVENAYECFKCGNLNKKKVLK